MSEYPDQLCLVAHFTRADLTQLRNWRDLARRLDAVRRTFATTSKPLTLNVPSTRGTKRVSVIVTDTMLLAPAKMKSLERLGAALGIPKVSLPAGYSKDRMDLFQQGAPEAFGNYAITDTIIAARWPSGSGSCSPQSWGFPATCQPSAPQA